MFGLFSGKLSAGISGNFHRNTHPGNIAIILWRKICRKSRTGSDISRRLITQFLCKKITTDLGDPITAVIIISDSL